MAVLTIKKNLSTVLAYLVTSVINTRTTLITPQMNPQVISMIYTIRPVKESEKSSWYSLWQAYLVFYESSLPDNLTDTIWKRIHDSDNQLQCRVAEDPETGDIVGLVQFFPHQTTWNINPVCYLNDLYVNPNIRGGGIGAALINAVEEEAANQGWEEIYWLTQQHNKVARGLYDKITGGTAGFVNYAIDMTKR